MPQSEYVAHHPATEIELKTRIWLEHTLPVQSRAPPIAAPASVFIGPGEMAFTRMPSGPRSLAR